MFLQLRFLQCSLLHPVLCPPCPCPTLSVQLLMRTEQLAFIFRIAVITPNLLPFPIRFTPTLCLCRRNFPLISLEPHITVEAVGSPPLPRQLLLGLCNCRCTGAGMGGGHVLAPNFPCENWEEAQTCCHRRRHSLAPLALWDFSNSLPDSAKEVPTHLR